LGVAGFGVDGTAGFDVGAGLALAGATGFGASFASGFGAGAAAGFDAGSGFALSWAFAGNQADENCNNRHRTVGTKTNKRTDPRIEVHEFLIVGR
jgi:hypothetical protein